MKESTCWLRGKAAFLASWGDRTVFSLCLLAYLEAVCKTCRELLSSGFYKIGTCWLTLLPSPVYTWHPQVKQEGSISFSFLLPPEEKYQGERRTGKGKVRENRLMKQLCLERLHFNWSYSLQDLTLVGMLKMPMIVFAVSVACTPQYLILQTYMESADIWASSGGPTILFILKHSGTASSQKKILGGVQFRDKVELSLR